MGNNINYNIQELDNSIERLKTLSVNWMDSDAKRNGNPPESSGGGKTINMLESLVKECEEVHTIYTLLINNTISFLEKTKMEIIAADEEAAEAIKE